MESCVREEVASPAGPTPQGLRGRCSGEGRGENSNPVIRWSDEGVGAARSQTPSIPNRFGQQYERCVTMRSRSVLGVLAIAVMGLCSAASADMVIYDNFDSADVDTSLWTVEGSAYQSGSIVTVGGYSGNSGWSSLTSTATYNASDPNTYEFKYINSSGTENPYFGLMSAAGNNVFFRQQSGAWNLYVNGTIVGANLGAPTSQHPYDFVRTANTWQLWDGGAWPDYVPTLMCETAPDNVGFTAGEKLSYWIAIRPTPGQISLGYVAGAITPIPEPAFSVLLVTGLVGLLAYAWKKRR
jgi:hypothetical protein